MFYIHVLQHWVVNHGLQREGIVQEITRKIDDSIIGLTLQVKALEDEKIVTDTKIKGLEKANKEMVDKMISLEEKNKTMINIHNTLQEENDGIKTEVLLMKNEIEQMKDDVIRNEQYARKNNVKIYGLHEDRDESCVDIVRSMIKDNLHIEINSQQIAVAHRINGKTGKPRPIIVRFEQYDVKLVVLKQRRRLKGSGM